MEAGRCMYLCVRAHRRDGVRQSGWGLVVWVLVVRWERKKKGSIMTSVGFCSWNSGNEILNCSCNRMRRKREVQKEEEIRKREKKILVNRVRNKLWKNMWVSASLMKCQHISWNKSLCWLCSRNYRCKHRKQTRYKHNQHTERSVFGSSNASCSEGRRSEQLSEMKNELPWKKNNKTKNCLLTRKKKNIIGRPESWKRETRKCWAACW